ncbi:hypothetical protein SAMN05444410_101126 [Hydrobacter penzbergensis]|jgi:hypothetical protein|uniref:Uncharacterized protein n=1 Tax=Hydrobacter penzbergensis TaxID=1235997 RepID=A0A8X8IC95_9BACT|nr:hypothetical protein [Hydrobacter penzbergensis]MBN8718180.1 hypothetical protein [Sediminibacterium magnilacihabitans]PQV62357.1 hypothetical protein CLV53_101635 [Sediminibacterium magnilacihabitans]SDW05532.1 hypothetical protein SAMN05444410_101126 [Hydrobacter penzbergensis]
MKVRLMSIVLLMMGTAACTEAQMRIDPSKMNYLLNTKTNNILYRDTVYRGSREFRMLFERTGDPDLMHLYKRHQTSKIMSQVLTLAGTVAIVLGVSEISSGNNDQKTPGWLLVTGGFVSATYGGYLLLKSQQQLLQAVTVFNARHNTASLGIGVSSSKLGLVYKF